MGRIHEWSLRIKQWSYCFLVISLVVFLFGYVITMYTLYQPELPDDASDDAIVVDTEIRSTVNSPEELVYKLHNRILDSIDMLTHRHALSVISVVEPTCSAKGYTVYGCYCGNQYVADETPMLDHVWGNWAVTKPATSDTEGVKWRQCLHCDAGEYGVVPTIEKGHAANYMGRWQIDSVGVDVGLYRQYANEGGPIVDAVDSATYFTVRNGGMVVGDHVNQGFYRIKKCQPGDIAVIQYDDGRTARFVCDRVIQGHNKVKFLSDLDGNCLYDLYPGALFCYTCNETWENVTIVIFYPE